MASARLKSWMMLVESSDLRRLQNKLWRWWALWWEAILTMWLTSNSWSSAIQRMAAQIWETSSTHSPQFMLRIPGAPQSAMQTLKEPKLTPSPSAISWQILIRIGSFRTYPERTVWSVEVCKFSGMEPCWGVAQSVVISIAVLKNLKMDSQPSPGKDWESMTELEKACEL